MSSLNSSLVPAALVPLVRDTVEPSGRHTASSRLVPRSAPTSFKLTLGLRRLPAAGSWRPKIPESPGNERRWVWAELGGVEGRVG